MKTILALFALIAVAAAGCPPLWTSGGTSCYRYFRTIASFDQAQSMCMDFGNCNGDMAHLVEIRSPAEEMLLHKYLSMFVPEPPTLPIWINLRLQQSPNGQPTWRWLSSGIDVGTSGASVSMIQEYTNFGTPNLPQSGPCVRTRPNALGMTWMSSQCNQRFGFVCEMPSGARPFQPPPRRPSAVTAVQTSGRLTQADTAITGRKNTRKTSRL